MKNVSTTFENIASPYYNIDSIDNASKLANSITKAISKYLNYPEGTFSIHKTTSRVRLCIITPVINSEFVVDTTDAEINDIFDVVELFKEQGLTLDILLMCGTPTAELADVSYGSSMFVGGVISKLYINDNIGTLCNPISKDKSELTVASVEGYLTKAIKTKSVYTINNMPDVFGVEDSKDYRNLVKLFGKLNIADTFIAQLLMAKKGSMDGFSNEAILLLMVTRDIYKCNLGEDIRLVAKGRGINDLFIEVRNSDYSTKLAHLEVVNDRSRILEVLFGHEDNYLCKNTIDYLADVLGSNL